MRRTRRSLTVILPVFAACLLPVGAQGVQELTLPLAWYQVVEPWRYEEARRFEAGWNRGADAVPDAGRVRSPLAGVVQFVGVVAGTRVVTVRSRFGGLPVVLTFSGLDESRVAQGDRLDAGAELGTAARVHVGVYDAARRIRYLPVRSEGREILGHVGGSHDSTPIPRYSSPLADAVARRLADAIDGSVQSASPRPSGAQPHAGAALGGGGEGGAPVGTGGVAAPVAGARLTTRGMPDAKPTPSHAARPVTGQGSVGSLLAPVLALLRNRSLVPTSARAVAGIANETREEAEPGSTGTPLEMVKSPAGAPARRTIGGVEGRGPRGCLLYTSPSPRDS